MPKMTKAQARKRLSEAYDKLGRVWISRAGGHLTAGDSGKIHDAMGKIEKVIQRLR